MSHTSIEVGHLYMEDFIQGPDRLTSNFKQVARWLEPAVSSARTDGGKVRFSTCFLIDDYFTQFSTPQQVLSDLVGAADKAGLTIDYVARETGCAITNGIRLAEIVESRIIADPSPGTSGFRPPASITGWLSNGQRSPSDQAQAMGGAAKWAPPSENAARNHSVFVDVELWDETDDGRRWSCPFLASVWQLLRLGLLRNNGKAISVAVPLDVESLPESWNECPSLWQLSAKAKPFSAYQTVSIIGSRFIGIEHAVRTILGQIGIDQSILGWIDDRASGEGLTMPPRQIVDRVGYVFLAGSE